MDLATRMIMILMVAKDFILFLASMIQMQD